MPLVDRLGIVPERVEWVLASRAGAQLGNARTGSWAPSRVLAHMLSYARHNGAFIYLIALMTDPIRQPWDEEAEIETERWLYLDTAGYVSALQKELAPTIDLLSGTPDASWGRPGVHPTEGRRSLRAQVESHANHMHEHIGQLADALQV